MKFSSKVKRLTVLTLAVLTIGVATYGYSHLKREKNNRIKAVSCLRSLADTQAIAVAQREQILDALATGGHVIVMRHALTTPGDTDPSNFTLADRSTQRNLSEAGQDQARLIKEVFKENGIKVGKVLSSQYARCLETGELAFGMAQPEPFLNALTSDQNLATNQSWQFETVVNNWAGPENLVLISHSANIKAAIHRQVGPADLIVVKPNGGGGVDHVGILPIDQLRPKPATLPATQPVHSVDRTS